MRSRMLNHSLIATIITFSFLFFSCGEANDLSVPNPPDNPLVEDKTFRIFENSLVGYVVGDVVVKFSDGREWEYAILSGNTEDAFLIENTVGRIRVAKSDVIYYETISIRRHWQKNT